MKVTNETSIIVKHGKDGKHSRGYYYEGPQGQQLFRARREDYQKNQSPKDAMRIGPNNRSYPTAKGWKLAMLQKQWKLNNPFETWYEQYLVEISEKAAEKTASEDTSDYMLRHQAEILEAQAAALRAQLKARHQQ